MWIYILSKVECFFYLFCDFYIVLLKVMNATELNCFDLQLVNKEGNKS